MIKVLLIDDEPRELKRLVGILSNSTDDFEIFSAISVKTAIKIALTKKVDIIVSDWQMPEQSGIDGVKIFKNHPELREIPVLILTGVMLDVKNIKLALDSGADDFIRKPVDAIEFIARINATLRTVQYYKDKVEAEKKISQIQNMYLKEKNEKLSSLLFQFERKNKALMAVKRKVSKLIGSVSDLTSHVSEVENIVDSEVNTEQDWEIFNMHLKLVDDKLTLKLKSKFPKLTDYDLRLCVYSKFNLSNQQIADVMNIESKSVHTAKNRLRKKLGLESATELSQYLQSL